MIHWAWLIAAFIFGGMLGFISAAICAAASMADEEAEKFYKE